MARVRANQSIRMPSRRGFMIARQKRRLELLCSIQNFEAAEEWKRSLRMRKPLV
jgi:hypothetical protein